MAASLQALVESAWAALWNPAGPYDLPGALRRGRREGLVFVRPLDLVSFPETGRIVLMNREPWGSVSLNLTNNAVSQLDTVTGEGYEFDEATGAFSGKIRFTELKYTASYFVYRGEATGSALRLASRSLSLGAADDGNVALAQQYQNELVTTDNGRFMVGTYYDNNAAYVQAFQNQNFAYNYKYFQVTPNSGKNTAYFANQTSNAASSQNRGTVAVNQDPDYTPHAFAIQNFLIAACQSQNNQTAATAATTFGNNVCDQNPDTPQTVNQVMNTVASASRDPQLQSSTARTLSALPTVNSAHRPAPDWRTVPGWTEELQKRVEQVCLEIKKEEEDVRTGVKLRENSGAPVEGACRAYFSTSVLTVTGTVKRDEKTGESLVEFTSLDGPVPEVNIQLSVFPGQLHGQVEQTLAKANFLKALLGKKAVSALAGPPLLKYMSRLMALAIGEKLGPLGAK